MKIKLYNKIASCGLERLPADFEVAETAADYDGILVRSADLHEEAFPATLRAIARAGAGVNNIPLDKCTAAGITVFNTPGANAQAVRELCLAALLLTSRKIADGIEWSKTLAGNADALKIVEKEKSKFQGPEIFGKTLGVIGLGAVGGGLAGYAAELGMNVLGYDPYISVPAAWQMNPKVKKTDDLDEIFRNADYISVHVPSLPSTRGMLNRENFAKMKKGGRILNLARADLAVDEDVLAALADGTLSAYFTDFPTGALAGKPGVIATPHLGASTPEAEDNCAMMACDEIADFLLNGNIRNSVNMPAVSAGRNGNARVGIFYRAGEETEVALAPFFAKARVTKACRGEIAYALADGESFDLDKIRAVSGVIRATAY